MASLRRWGECLWNLKGGVRFSKLGGAFFLLEFEDRDEAKRVLMRGLRRFKENLLHLERWSQEAGCLHLRKTS